MADEVRMTCTPARGYYYADNEPKKVFALFEIVPTDAVSHIRMALNKEVSMGQATVRLTQRL